MSLDDFRADVRAWCRALVPAGWREAPTDVSDDEFVSFQKEWFQELRTAGYAVPHWPGEWGGGMSTAEQVVLYQELAAHDAPRLVLAFVSIHHAASTLLAAGTDEQRHRHLPAILDGEIWCQGFSEPEAGSDLAALRTRAERRGDVYVVNGQKVWTSSAHFADLCFTYVRTDVDAPKHAGISVLVIDLRTTQGVVGRPFRQLTGKADFAEVFFTDARVPVENVVGGVNQGWSVAMTTLANERVGLGGGGSLGFPLTAPGGSRAEQALEVSVEEFVGKARGGGQRVPAMMMTRGAEAFAALAKERGVDTDPSVRQNLARLHALNSLNRWNMLRAKAAVKAGGRPGPEASLGKLMVSRITRLSRDVGMQVAGPTGVLAGSDGPLGGSLALQYLGAPAPSIYGGSDEIQHNIIGERVLGLPREPDNSKAVAFKDLRTGTQS